MRTERIVAALERMADADDAYAAYAEEHYADASPGSAAATIARHARIRARSTRGQAQMVANGTWLTFLHAIGRCVDGYCPSVHPPVDICRRHELQPTQRPRNDGREHQPGMEGPMASKKETLSDALAGATTDGQPSTLPRGKCPDCGGNVPLRKDNLTREHRIEGVVCTGTGKLAVDEAAGETPPPEPPPTNETKAQERARLEGEGHTFTTPKYGLTHNGDCPACISAAGGAAVSHPVTGEVIEPSLEQQTIAAERPGDGDAWSGAQAASLNPWDIDPDPDNARGDDHGDLTELANSLITEGMLQPVIVYPTPDARYRLVAGHRRVAAARMANLPLVPALVRPDLESARRLAATQATENLQRRNLNAIQEAKAIKRLADAGAKQEEIATRLSVNQGHISKRLALLKLTPDAQDLVANKVISVEDGVELARLPKGAQPRAIELLTSNNPRNAVARAKGDYERDQALQAIVDRLSTDGIDVVEWPGYSWPDDMAPLAVDGQKPDHIYSGRGVVDETPAKHKRCPGHLATVMTYAGEPVIIYLCSDPGRHGLPDADARRLDINSTRQAEQAEREAEKAAYAARMTVRRQAALTVAGAKLARPAMTDFLAHHAILRLTVGGDFLGISDGEETERLEALEALGIAWEGEGPEEVLDEALNRFIAGVVTDVGPLRFAFAAAVMAVGHQLTYWGSPRGYSLDVCGHPAIVAFYELLATHAGYETTDDDQPWMVTPEPWVPAPMPAGDVPDGAVGWYGGDAEDDDEARWIFDTAELAAILDLVDDGVVVVLERPDDGNQQGNDGPSEEETEAGAAQDASEAFPGGRCPASGRRYNGPGLASAWPCPVCKAPVATDKKGVVAEHLVPELPEGEPVLALDTKARLQGMRVLVFGAVQGRAVYESNATSADETLLVSGLPRLTVYWQSVAWFLEQGLAEKAGGALWPTEAGVRVAEAHDVLEGLVDPSTPIVLASRLAMALEEVQA